MVGSSLLVCLQCLCLCLYGFISVRLTGYFLNREVGLSLIMDASVMGLIDIELATKASRMITNLIRDVGGLITLNWHTEAYCSKYIYLNYLTVLKNTLDPLLEDNDVWIATPLEIAKWWNSRSEVLKSRSLG